MKYINEKLASPYKNNILYWLLRRFFGNFMYLRKCNSIFGLLGLLTIFSGVNNNLSAAERKNTPTNKNLPVVECDSCTHNFGIEYNQTVGVYKYNLDKNNSMNAAVKGIESYVANNNGYSIGGLYTRNLANNLFAEVIAGYRMQRNYFEIDRTSPSDLFHKMFTAGARLGTVFNIENNIALVGGVGVGLASISTEIMIRYNGQTGQDFYFTNKVNPPKQIQVFADSKVGLRLTIENAFVTFGYNFTFIKDLNKNVTSQDLNLVNQDGQLSPCLGTNGFKNHIHSISIAVQRAC